MVLVSSPEQITAHWKHSQFEFQNEEVLELKLCVVIGPQSSGLLCVAEALCYIPVFHRAFSFTGSLVFVLPNNTGSHKVHSAFHDVTQLKRFRVLFHSDHGN